MKQIIHYKVDSRNNNKLSKSLILLLKKGINLSMLFQESRFSSRFHKIEGRIVIIFLYFMREFTNISQYWRSRIFFMSMKENMILRNISTKMIVQLGLFLPSIVKFMFILTRLRATHNSVVYVFLNQILVSFFVNIYR
jgi:hypothetical protein